MKQRVNATHRLHSKGWYHRCISREIAIGQSSEACQPSPSRKARGRFLTMKQSLQAYTGIERVPFSCDRREYEELALNRDRSLLDGEDLSRSNDAVGSCTRPRDFTAFEPNDLPNVGRHAVRGLSSPFVERFIPKTWRNESANIKNTSLWFQFFDCGDSLRRFEKKQFMNNLWVEDLIFGWERDYRFHGTVWRETCAAGTRWYVV